MANATTRKQSAQSGPGLPAGLTKAEVEQFRQELSAQEEQAQRPQPTARDRLNSHLLRSRDHLDGCPGAEEQGATRVEVYPQQIPTTAPVQEWGGPGDICTNVRCIECGGNRLLAGTPAHNIARLLGESTETAAQPLDDTL